MGIASSTQFVGTDAKPAAQSYQPCHIFGNPDIFGIGIRVSFYLLYAAAILVLLVARPDALRPIRLALSAIASAVFINLCANSTTKKTLVILDWWIALSYVIFPFLLLLVPRTVVRKFGKNKYNPHHEHEGYDEKSAIRYARKFLKTDISIACMLVVWSAFIFATPWLYWKGISYGAKIPDCDVKVLFLLVPITVYRDGFVIALKVFSVIGVLIGVGCILFAFVIVATNTIRILLKQDLPLSRPGALERLAHFIWAVVVLVALGLTLAQVEATIAINHVDIDHSYVASTGQLLSLVLAIGAVFNALSMVFRGRECDEVEEDVEEIEVTRSHDSHSTASGGPLANEVQCSQQ